LIFCGTLVTFKKEMKNNQDHGFSQTLILTKHKKMKKLLFLTLFLTTFLHADWHAGYPPHAQDTSGGRLSPAFSAANAASITWITLIDQKQYRASWAEMGSLFRDLVSRGQWQGAMKEVRAPLGSNRTRKVASHKSTDTLPNGTQGNFMIITYRSGFSNKPNVEERVILMTDGHLHIWKVISYDIKTN